ncbi:transcription factor [Carpediemonas membranifera]|uniref:Myb-like DNA-binding domain n=1 Tax=Carpediemonas membranifera TaxID=201153 RepID=A0A8J6B2Q2_9EUKA|nr:Myb-like DNA-binding domain [Carpediemonas membranifera]KAG9394462.1 transcription factor [Carpediemonas membranifera]|eukprot:KAG9394458.1 Myb-like DNA-binding domain [Carpediemonas membranifera]
MIAKTAFPNTPLAMSPIAKPKGRKQRVTWTEELHKKFEDIVMDVGIRSAQPRYILTLMDTDGLSRENVASHLQKFRHKIMRIHGLASIDDLSDEHGMRIDEIRERLPTPPPRRRRRRRVEPSLAALTQVAFSEFTPTTQSDASPPATFAAPTGRHVVPIIGDPDRHHSLPAFLLH